MTSLRDIPALQNSYQRLRDISTGLSEFVKPDASTGSLNAAEKVLRELLPETVAAQSPLSITESGFDILRHMEKSGPSLFIRHYTDGSMFSVDLRYAGQVRLSASTGNVLTGECFLKPVDPAYNDFTLVAKGYEWASQEGGERQVAVQRMISWLAAVVRAESAQHSFLDLHGLQLDTLPELPSRVMKLDVSGNRLRIPLLLPAGLTVLKMSSNQAGLLPVRPQGLTVVFVPSDRETSSVQPDPRPFCYSPEPARQDAVPPAASGETGIIPQQQTAGDMPALDKAVACWYPPDRQEAVRQSWAHFSTREESQAFCLFLEKLHHSAVARTDAFRQHVCAWLDELLSCPDLRNLSFGIANEACESCSDRASLGWNKMQLSRLLRTAQSLPPADFVALAEQVFRLECLENIAGRKASTIDRSDPVEVFLAYQSGLKTRLALPVQFVPDMDYRRSSKLTEADLDAAADVVKTREKADFRGWFLDWDVAKEKMRAMMDENNRNNVEDRLYESYEKHHAMLQAQADIANNDVAKAIGAQAKAAANEEIYGPMANRLFSRSRKALGGSLR